MNRALVLALLLATPFVSAGQDSPKHERPSYEECRSLAGSPYMAECVIRAEERSAEPDCATASFWQTRKREDPMTDSKSCSVTPAAYSKTDGGLAVLVTEAGVSFTTLGSEYPGSTRKIRVDKHAPISFASSATAADVKLLLSQLISAKFVTTEYRDWPYNLARHRRLPVCELVQKIDDCKASIK